jgi:hypothetical protein
MTAAGKLENRESLHEVHTHRRHPKRRPLAPAIGLHRAASVLATALLALLVGVGATPAAAETCASLAGLTLPDTTITTAQSVAAGTYSTGTPDRAPVNGLTLG